MQVDKDGPMQADIGWTLPGEALEFHEHIKGVSPRERIVFLVGPPVAISRVLGPR